MSECRLHPPQIRMDLSYWQKHAKEPEYHCDIAVIGGGVVGCSAAYWLRKILPNTRVAILERDRIASGASGRNAGFLLQGAGSDYVRDYLTYGSERARRLLRFTRENRDLLFREIGSEAQLESKGSLVVAGSEEEDSRLRQAVPGLRADGTPAVYLDSDETSRRISSRGFFGSLYVPSGAVMNPVSLVTSLARRSAATVLEHHDVRSIDVDRDDVIIETSIRNVRATRVIVAINAWLPILFPDLARFVRPVRAQMISTTPMPQRWLDVPVYSHDGYYYVRQTRSGVVLAGGARHLHVNEEVGYELRTTLSVQRDIESYLKRHFPSCTDLQVDLRWAGTMGFSPDLLPCFGSLSRIPGSLWAAGFSGHGMCYGFRFGKMLAEMMAGRTDVENSSMFKADRFATTFPIAAVS